MKVAVIADMEGVSTLTDPCAILAFCRSYWVEGRRRMTADVAAAARGLLAAGADEVVVLDGHSSGNEGNNLLPELLPARAHIEPWATASLAEHGVDAILLVGWHARGGVPAFLSHTHVPDLRLRVDGELTGESHSVAWRAGLPLLGTIGSDANARTVGPAFSGQPYLEVQRTDAWDRVTPVFPEVDEASAAIEAFAADALRDGGIRVAAPSDFVIEASLPATDAGASLLRDTGWTQVSETEFEATASTFAQASPLVDVAVRAAFEQPLPYFSTFPLTSLDALEAVHDEPVLVEGRAWFDRWLGSKHPEWLTPQPAAA